jgi:hypothetical protein
MSLSTGMHLNAFPLGPSHISQGIKAGFIGPSNMWTFSVHGTLQPCLFADELSFRNYNILTRFAVIAEVKSDKLSCDGALKLRG